MCVGIDHCIRKNCIEQERCLFPKEKYPKNIRINPCSMHKKFCSNEKACEIMGQCILDHPLVKANKSATKELRKKGDIQRVVNIVARLMPSLNKPGKKLNNASRNNKSK